MKLKEILAASHIEFQEQLEVEIKSEINSHTLYDRKRVIVLEKALALRELTDAFSKVYGKDDEEVSVENLQPFVEFFAKRWQRIRNTPLAYTHAYGLSLTDLCLMLAKAIAPVLKKSPYQIMMPTLVNVDNIFSGDEIDELKLHQFVLSEDGTRVIHVWDCLLYAENDGVLKHTSLFPALHEEPMLPGVKALNEFERALIARHSLASQNYHSAIQARIDVSISGMSTGAFLKRLIDSLREGSVGYKGTEYRAGDDANAGIVDFYQYFNLLSEEQQSELLACRCSAYDGERTFSEYWKRLTAPDRVNDEEKQLSIYCIAIIRDRLQSILDHNPKLYNQYQSNTSAKELCLELCRSAVEQTRNQFKKLLDSEVYESLACYGREGEFRLERNVYRNHCHDIENLSLVFTLKPDLQIKFLRETLGQEHLVTILWNPADQIQFVEKLHRISQRAVRDLLGLPSTPIVLNAGMFSRRDEQVVVKSKENNKRLCMQASGPSG